MARALEGHVLEHVSQALFSVAFLERSRTMRRRREVWPPGVAFFITA